MALTLNSTMMDESANSYVDQDFADDYFENHVVSTKRDAWAAMTDEAKQTALIQACYTLEQFRFTASTTDADISLQYDNVRRAFFYGVPGTPGVAVKFSVLQQLQFPRSIDSNSLGVYIPEPMKMAQCEQAIFLATFDESNMIDRLQGIVSQSFSVAGISISQRMEAGGIAIAPMAQQLINPFIIRRTGTRMQRS